MSCRVILTATTEVFSTQRVTDHGEPWRRFKVKFMIMLPSKEQIPLQQICSHVDVELHETFKNPKRTLKPPFELEEEAWGSSHVNFHFKFHESFAKPHVISHYVDLNNPKTTEYAIYFRRISEDAKKKYLCTPETALFLARKLHELQMECWYDEKTNTINFDAGLWPDVMNLI